MWLVNKGVQSMRTEIPIWVAGVVIVVVILIAAVVIWRGTGVQKTEFLPGEKLKEYWS